MDELRERIINLLKEKNEPMNANAIAEELNESKKRVLEVINRTNRDLIELVLVKDGDITGPVYKAGRKA